MSAHNASTSNRGGSLAVSISEVANKRSRSRLGCVSCRTRKKACDRIHPVCSACARLDLECDWSRKPQTRKRRESVDIGGSSTSTRGDRLSSLPSLPEESNHGFLETEAPDAQGDLTISLAAASQSESSHLTEETTSNNTSHEGLAPFDVFASVLAVPPVVDWLSTWKDDSALNISSHARDAVNINPAHSDLLDYYKSALSFSVVGSETFSSANPGSLLLLAERTSDTVGGSGLLMSLQAWAARHKTNTGDARSEIISERLAQEAQVTMVGRVASLATEPASEEELLALVAGLQLLLHCKMYKGDVYGLRPLRDHLRISLMDFLGKGGWRNSGIASSVLRIVLLVECRSSFFICGGDRLLSRESTADIIDTYSKLPLSPEKTYWAVCGSLFSFADILHADADIHTTLKHCEEALREIDVSEEQARKYLYSAEHLWPDRGALRLWHISGRLLYRSILLREPPTTLQVRCLVDDALTILEEMKVNNLPFLSTCHWPLFVVGNCALPGVVLSPRAKVDAIYTETLNQLGIRHTRRTQAMLHELWAKTPQGNEVIDWISHLGDLGWEIVLL